MSVIQTEYDFVLPKGFVDESGTLHKEGKMRLATAADEILPMKDPRVANNEAYLSIILLSRVITRLGTLPMVSTQVIEKLFQSDYAYLLDLYGNINQDGANVVPVECPQCKHTFDMEIPLMGG